MAAYPRFSYRVRAQFTTTRLVGGAVTGDLGREVLFAMGSASSTDDYISITRPDHGQLLAALMATTGSTTSLAFVDQSTAIPSAVGLAGDNFGARDSRHYRRRM